MRQLQRKMREEFKKNKLLREGKYPYFISKFEIKGSK